MYLSDYEVILDLNEFRQDYPDYVKVAIVSDVEIIQGDDPSPHTSSDWDLKLYDLKIYFIDSEGDSDEIDLKSIKDDLRSFLISGYTDDIFDTLPELFEEDSE